MIKKTDDGVLLHGFRPVMWNDQVLYWAGLVSCEEIANAFDQLTYDSKIQRGHDVVKRGETELKVPLINKTHVREMVVELQAGGSLPGTLTWNIRVERQANTDDFYAYDSDNESLLIKSKLITMPDSAHRHHAIHSVMNNANYGPYIKDNQFMLHVYALTEKDERRFFVNKNGKQKQVNSNRIKYLDDKRPNEFLRQLIANSDLNGRVETIHQGKYSPGTIVMFETLLDMLFGSRGILAGKDIDSTAVFRDCLHEMTVFFNGLLAARPEFSVETTREMTQSRRLDMFLEPSIWGAYGLIYSHYPDKRNYAKLCEELLNFKISVVNSPEPVYYLSKKNPKWHGTVIPYINNSMTETPVHGTAVSNNRSIREKICEYFYFDVIKAHQEKGNTAFDDMMSGIMGGATDSTEDLNDEQTV